MKGTDLSTGLDEFSSEDGRLDDFGLRGDDSLLAFVEQAESLLDGVLERKHLLGLHVAVDRQVRDHGQLHRRAYRQKGRGHHPAMSTTKLTSTSSSAIPE